MLSYLVYRAVSRAVCVHMGSDSISQMWPRGIMHPRPTKKKGIATQETECPSGGTVLHHTYLPDYSTYSSTLMMKDDARSSGGDVCIHTDTLQAQAGRWAGRQVGDSDGDGHGDSEGASTSGATYTTVGYCSASWRLAMYYYCCYHYYSY